MKLDPRDQDICQCGYPGMLSTVVRNFQCPKAPEADSDSVASQDLVCTDGQLDSCTKITHVRKCKADLSNTVWIVTVFATRPCKTAVKTVVFATLPCKTGVKSVVFATRPCKTAVKTWNFSLGTLA